jgi:hypothetical protein
VNKGHLATYNEGLALARGRYVGILSADDYCLNPATVERQVALFEANPSVGLVYTAHVVTEPDGRTTPIIPWPRDAVRPGLDEFRRLIWGNYILHSGTLLRADVQAALGPYDPRLPQSGDWDLWLRAALGYDVGYLATPLYAYRMHRSNMQASGIPPREQADQNLLTLEQAFGVLGADGPADIQALRTAALRHALLQTVWFDLFNGRRLRAYRGLLHALSRRSSLVLGGELWRAAARLALLAILGGERYRALAQRLDRGHDDATYGLEPSA